MKKGDEVEAEVLRLDFPNKGIAEAVDPATGAPVKLRIKGVLPGQRVLCRILRNGSGKKEARLLSVLRPAPIETEAPCPHFARCGGCSYQSLSAEAELALKEEQVQRLLEPVFHGPASDGLPGGEGSAPYPVQTPQWDPACDAPSRHGYRNKMEFTWGDSEKGGPLALGLHRRGSMHDIESVTECRIVDADYRKILRASLDYFSTYYERGAIDFYHRMSGGGYLRHLLIRKAAFTGEILVDLVTTSEAPQLPEARSESAVLSGYRDVLLALPLEGHIVGILHTVNDARSDVVRDEGTEVLCGQDYFYEELLGLRFRITPFSFFQTNSQSAALLYQRVREYVRFALEDQGDGLDRLGAPDRRKPVVYDLYSGTGTIAQLVSPVAERVAGIEIVPEAVESARANARENRVENCFFFAGDVLKLVDDPIVTETVGPPDLIILDPPREGIHPKALPKLLSFGVAHIIYISCKPTSLARDLDVFLRQGYRVERMGVINQFPCAVHVETVCLLSNRKPDSYVHLNLKMEDYYRIKDAQKEQDKK